MNQKELCDYIDDLVLHEFPRSTEEQIQEKCSDFLAKYNSLDDKIEFSVIYEEKLFARLALMRDKRLRFEEAIITVIRRADPTFMSNFEELKKAFHDQN